MRKEPMVEGEVMGEVEGVRFGVICEYCGHSLGDHWYKKAKKKS
jgi:hypothetical protein